MSDEIDEHNTATQQLPNSTLAEEGAPADYSVITEGELLADCNIISTETANAQDTTSKEVTPGDYSVITEAPDTSNEGLVYSAVVVKDGKRTTVKTMTTTENDDSEQTDTD